MANFEKHLFVCCNVRPEGHPRGCCGAKSSEAIREAFKEEIQRRGLKGKVRANRAGCLDQCEHGITVVVYPEGVWYGFVKLEDVGEIVEEHLVGGRPVARLVLPQSCVNTPSCPHKRGAAVKIAGFSSRP